MDLSSIGLIDGGFSTNRINTNNNFAESGVALNNILPQAKLGQGNYIYIWSGGYVEWNGGNSGDGINYFGMGIITSVSDGNAQINMGLTVRQAYDIDKKVDDGFPQSGRVTAMFDGYNEVWSSALASDTVNTNTGLTNASYGPATSGYHSGDDNSTTTCYDYPTPGTPAFPLVYSISTNAQRTNCALSFQFQ